MTSPFNFDLDERATLWIVVVSIFLVSLSVGMLVFGMNDLLSANTLNYEVFHDGKEMLHHFK